jgi:Cysteine-rich secretory protein family
MNSRFWVLLLALGTLTLVLSAWNPLPEPPNVLGLTNAEQGIWAGINLERTRAGLSALKFDVRLSAAARGHAKDMADRNFFDHRSGKPGFDTPGDRIHQAGSFEQAWAENIALLQGEPDSRIVTTFVTGWMKSPPHFKNIMTASFTHTGIGVFKSGDGRVYGVQVFSSREFETTFDNVSGDVRFNDLELRGVNKPNLELAVFSGRNYLGIIPQDSAGRFVMKIPFAINTKFDVGWREKGSSKNFLLAKYLQTPNIAKSGKLETKNYPGTPPFSLEANVLVQTSFSQTLTIKFFGATKTLLVIEIVAGSEVRHAVQNNQVQLTCPALSPKRTVQIAHGSNITTEFIWNCATGKLEPSFGN